MRAYQGSEFFHHVVKSNYSACYEHPRELSALWNAMVSMNTVAEYIALERLERAGHQQMSQQQLVQQANEIRAATLHLEDLKYCAETLKHVRKIKDLKGGSFTLQAASTGVSPEDETTWHIAGFDLAKLMREALTELETFPELRKE
jgi:hypothetical protein